MATPLWGTYWQNDLQETMPARDRLQRLGLGYQPERDVGEAAQNLVLWLSQHSYVAPDRKTRTIACGCCPDLALNHRCNGCGCKGKCSLACGRRGRCHLGRSSEPEAPSGPARASTVVNAIALSPPSLVSRLLLMGLRGVGELQARNRNWATPIQRMAFPTVAPTLSRVGIRRVRRQRRRFGRVV